MMEHLENLNEILKTPLCVWVLSSGYARDVKSNLIRHVGSNSEGNKLFLLDENISFTTLEISPRNADVRLRTDPVTIEKLLHQHQQFYEENREYYVYLLIRPSMKFYSIQLSKKICSNWHNGTNKEIEKDEFGNYREKTSGSLTKAVR